MRARAVTAAAWLALACADERRDPPPAEFAELCGHVGPIRLFRLEPWRDVVSVGQWSEPVGQRRMFSVHYGDSVANGALWSTGPCGEDPRRLLSYRISSAWLIPKYEGLVLVCDFEAGMVEVIDPTGERPVRTLFEASSDICFGQRTAEGLAYIRPEGPDSVSGSLVMLPWPDDPWTGDAVPQIVLDGVDTYQETPGKSAFSTLQADESDLFFTTVDDELVRFSSADGSIEVVAAGVLDFELSLEPDSDDDDGWSRRRIVWQGTEQLDDDPEQPVGELVLLDRATAEQSSLGPGSLRAGNNTFEWAASGLMLLWMQVDDELRPRLYRLPSLSFTELPIGLGFDALLADERHMLVTVLADDSRALLDLETGEVQRIPGNPLVRYWPEEGVLALLPGADDANLYADSELWILGASGEAELVAERATILHSFLPDGRLLSNVSIEDDRSSDLLVIDPATLEERLIDRGVHVHSVNQHVADDTLSYAIPEGDRSGVWLARLAPRE